MLVVSRKKSEEVVVTIPENAVPGTEIVVKVTDIGNDKVRLGFQAPIEYLILRRELTEPQEANMPEGEGAAP